MKHAVFIVLIGATLLSQVVCAAAVSAKDEKTAGFDLPDAGILPDSRLYFFDKFTKNLGLLFTFKAEAKTQKALDYAGERLAEAVLMARKADTEALGRTIEGYTYFIATAADQARKARQFMIPGINADGLSEIARNMGIATAGPCDKVATAILKHLDVLDRVSDELPEAASERAGEALSRCREAALRSAASTLEILARDNAGRAADLTKAFMENRIQRVLALTESKKMDMVKETIDQAEHLFGLGSDPPASDNGDALVKGFIKRAQTAGIRHTGLPGQNQTVPK